MDDHHEVNSTNAMLELEVVIDAIVAEDVSVIDPVPMDEITMKRLRKLHEPRDPKSRHGVSSICMA